MYHTAVIGGGCLGAAAAISIQRRLKNSGEKVCLIEIFISGYIFCSGVNFCPISIF